MNDHDALDARVRAAHADSLAQLSPRVRAQLARRSRLAMAAKPAPGTRPALGWALAALAACAVVVGVFHPASQVARSPAPALATTTTAAPDTLDDNPDFYLWLASRDADSLASE
ncbi:MAG TPA: hypothetical protein VLM17_02475 [Xanthomonadaceae bacterium]|nr:hypothetical protein [Xanthomonadaceae bacterium]